MPTFNFWYKKQIIAGNLAKAIKKEKKVKIQFHSVDQDDKSDKELTPAIGFTTDTPSDWEEE